MSAALPEFVTVSVCGAEEVPTVCEAKVREVGTTAKFAVAVVPVPLSVMVCGEPDALSVTLTVAGLDPADAGLNLTEIWQEPPANTAEPQVFVSV